MAKYRGPTNVPFNQKGINELKNRGIPVDEAPPEQNKINIYLTQWDTDPISPWMIAHRFAHMIGDRNIGYGIKRQCKDAASNVMFNSIPAAAYKADPIHLLLGAFGTMRSARENNLNEADEPFHELVAQFIMTGSVKFKFNPASHYVKRFQIQNTPELQQKLIETTNIINQALTKAMADAMNYIYIW